MKMNKIDLNNLDKSTWSAFRFDQIASSISERVDPNNTDLKHYIGLEHIDSENIHITRMGSPDDVNGQKLRCYPGDVIFGRRRAYQRKAAVCEVEGFCSAHSLVLRANPEVIDPKLFLFFLHSDTFMHRAVDISVGSLSPTINWGTLKKQEFLLPPKGQQAPLAELLWAVDDVVIKNLVLSESQSVFLESLIEENLISQSKDGTLADYCSKDGVRIGPFGSLLHVKDYTTDGIPVVMPANIENGEISERKIARIGPEKVRELKNYRLQENDILFPRRGDLTKRTIVLKHQENWVCGTGTIRVRLNGSISPILVFHAVTSSYINHWLLGASVGTTMPNLNAGTIKKIPFKMPEDLSATEMLRKIESVTTALKRSKELVDSSKSIQKSLISQVF